MRAAAAACRGTKPERDNSDTGGDCVRKKNRTNIA